MPPKQELPPTPRTAKNILVMLIRMGTYLAIGGYSRSAAKMADLIVVLGEEMHVERERKKKKKG